MQRKILALCSAASLSALLIGCATVKDKWGAMTSRGPSATATLQAAAGKSVQGSASVTEKDGKLRLRASVTGLTPGLHGFHIHEKGDCSASDFSSAGPHFNPHGKAHGSLAGTRHAGDLGNLNANAEGKASADIELPEVTLDASASGIIGRALIVHEQADDLTSQPAGNAGARIACGVITLKQ